MPGGARDGPILGLTVTSLSLGTNLLRPGAHRRSVFLDLTGLALMAVHEVASAASHLLATVLLLQIFPGSKLSLLPPSWRARELTRS